MLILAGGLLAGSLLGVIIFFAGSGAQNTKQNSPVSGKAFPEVTLTDLNGSQVSLASYKGHPMIVNFWATWCAPCKVEMPLLQSYAQRYQELKLIGINNDESAQTVKKFLNDNNVQIEVLLDKGGMVASQFNVFGFPTTYFVDANGVMRGLYIGELDAELLNGYLPKIGIKP